MEPRNRPQGMNSASLSVWRIRDVYLGSDPDFYPFRIPDPKTATKERGEKKIFVIPFNVATNFTKLKVIFVLKC
jgi:hypothetical protein